MAVDRLQCLLSRCTVSAESFYAGALCGVSDFREGPTGQLHLVRSGALTVHHPGGEEHRIETPSLVFYPRPHAHRFIGDPGVDTSVACANVSFRTLAGNPLADALPPFVCFPLQSLHGVGLVLEVLFQEAFAERCGRQAVVDRLFEVVVVQVLRYLIDRGDADVGLIGGLAHPRIARALAAMHERPAENWSLATLAAQAGQSRSVFSQTFREVVGCTPGEYLTRWRVGLAQDQMLRGRPLKLIAPDVGYGSEAALSRAFSTNVGLSPREWKAREWKERVGG